MADDKNMDIDLSSEKARVDYFASARPEENEAFSKNHPEISKEGYDNILQSAIGNSISPDFLFNPNRYDTIEKIDGVNKNIGEEIERITGVLDKAMLGGPDLSITVSPFDIDNSQAGNKLRLAIGQNIKGINEYVSDLGNGEIDKKDLPDNLEGHDLRDLLAAQNLTISNYLKELGFPRTDDYKQPNNPQPDIDKLFPKESVPSVIDRTNETNVRKEDIKTETRTFTEIQSIPVQPIKPIENRNNIVSSPILSEIPRANIPNIVVPSNTQNTSISNKETKLTSPTSVTNTNNSNSSTSINTTNPNIVNNSNTEYKPYDAMDEMEYSLFQTKDGIDVKNENISKNSSPTHIIEKEKTSSITPTFDEPYDTMDDIEYSLFKTKNGVGVKNENMAITDTKNVHPIDSKTIKNNQLSTIHSVETPKTKTTEGLKITSETPRLEKSEPYGLKELKSVPTPQKDEKVEDVTTIGKSPEKQETEKIASNSLVPTEEKKEMDKTISTTEPVNLERLEGIMFQILNVLKGPILTIDSRVKYS